ncbi:uroporphyrinogen-III C-methyltransferase [Bryobacter aggregatus]|uniref:uroporphyrinogen-III C-methyltransferase n=1 Tax=Bryobacter aggregatus TaxID=360054 RepID=UPI0004E0F81F|nr:uroporphyrinogen-III C-methyltransferase [Bryobacter aggregatus]
MKVYLVGSGPGDPELLTVKAKRLLESADIVLYDHLSSPEALRLARGAEKIYVGKRRDDHSFPQDEIGQMLIEHWKTGKHVVRLKGGDPYVFGRGGEECEALAAAGVPFEVVPGISAAIGAAAYAGIPLTHRDYASSVAFVTGHHPAAIDWPKVAGVDTLVIFMGAFHFPELAAALIAAGRAADTPAAAVSWATRGEQRTVTGTIASLAAQKIASPAILYIGGVAALSERLNWFEKLPLHGVSVALTRPLAQSPDTAQKFAALGAKVIEYPTIEISDPFSFDPLDRAIGELEKFDWLIFTSANAVQAFAKRLAVSPHDLRSLRAKLCAVGPMTRKALTDMHLKVDVLPAEYVAESIAAALASHPMQGQQVLIPRAAIARDTVPDALRAMGAIVTIVEAYRTIVPASGPAPEADWITFTSSSTVKNFLALNEPDVISRYKTASIGPITTETMRMHGIEPTVEANPHTTQGVLDAILHYHHPQG